MPLWLQALIEKKATDEEVIDATDLYYLPGRQLTPAPTGVLTGTTYDDVTIILQP